MDRFRAAFDAIDVNAAVGEVDGIPAQRHQLDRPQPVPIRDQDHGRITVAAAIPRGGGNQAGNLGVGQILARTDRRGGRTVPITAVGATSARCCFVMIIQTSPRATADFMGSTAISGAAAEPFGMRETLNWRAFSVGGQPTPPQGWPAKGGNAQWRTANHRRDFF